MSFDQPNAVSALQTRDLGAMTKKITQEKWFLDGAKALMIAGGVSTSMMATAGTDNKGLAPSAQDQAPLVSAYAIKDDYVAGQLGSHAKTDRQQVKSIRTRFQADASTKKPNVSIDSDRAPVKKSGNTLNKADIESFVDQSARYTLKKDVDGFARLLSDDIKIMAVTTMLGETHTSVLTKGQYIEETKQGLDKTSDYQINYNLEDIVINGDTATVYATVDEKVMIAGKHFISEAKEVSKIKRINGKLVFTEMRGEVTVSPLVAL